MSTYDDYDRPPRRARTDRPPYPPDPNEDSGRPRPTKTDSSAPSDSHRGKSDIPPPPLGSAMKRDGSRTRQPALKPEFPDEASYLNGRSPDLERKTGDRDRRFRERREGYGSEEGELLKNDMRRQKSQREPTRQRPPYDDGPRGGSSELPVRGGPPHDRRRDDDGYDRRDDRRRDDRDDRRRPRDYEDRSHHRRDYDGDATDRRRAPRSGVEYGADPVKPNRRGDADRRGDRPRRRYDDESDSDDDRARRRRSQPAPRRNSRDDNDDYYDRDARDRRRRDDDRDDRRRPPRRRSHDDDDYNDRRDRDRRGKRDDDRDRRDDRRKEPIVKTGNANIDNAISKGQKYYGTIAPLLTPLVVSYLKNKK